jgi:hypothetical protein
MKIMKLQINSISNFMAAKQVILNFTNELFDSTPKCPKMMGVKRVQQQPSASSSSGPMAAEARKGD